MGDKGESKLKGETSRVRKHMISAKISVVGDMGVGD